MRSRRKDVKDLRIRFQPGKEEETVLGVASSQRNRGRTVREKGRERTISTERGLGMVGVSEGATTSAGQISVKRKPCSQRRIQKEKEWEARCGQGHDSSFETQRYGLLT